MKIEAWKSEHTGEIFEREAEYKKHMRAENAAIRKQKTYDDAKAVFFNWMAKEKEELITVDMIVPWILKNQKALMEGFNKFGKGYGWGGNDKFHPETDKITKIVLDVKYSPKVSNSHSCPRGGVTNWCAKNPHLPTSYPGFAGRLEGVLKRDNRHMGQYPMGDFLDMIGLRQGTGGGGNDRWGWDTKLFLDDWVGLSQTVMVDIIKGAL